jgi:DNA-binding SARP family transcriptional activator
MVRIRLGLLGRFAARTDDEVSRLVSISPPRHRGLLAYLAMRPDHTETRERLAALLWGDRPDRQARQSLRQCLLDLRKELEPVGIDVLKVDRETVALDGERIVVDAREFLALANSNDPALLGGAVALYGGEFLDSLRK